MVIDTVACCTAPLCSLGTLPSPAACTPDTDFVSFTSSDPDDGLDTCILYGPGELVNGGWQYEPVGGETVNVRIVCHNSCGDSCVTEFERTYPQRVQITCDVPADTTIVQCDPAEVSLSAGAVGASCEVTNGPGTISGGNWTYTPSGDETVSVTIRCISTDFCDTCEATFSVTFDVNDPPTIQCPDNLTFECDSVGDFGSPTVNDDRGQSPTYYVSTRDSIAGNCEQEYTLRLRYVVKDECGDSAYCDQSIAVVDTTAPVITCPELTVYACDSVPPRGDWPKPTATDNCDDSVAITLLSFDSLNVECPQNWVYTLVWEATDGCGNADTCRQTVSVVDRQAPVITCPADTTFECDELPDALANVKAGDVLEKGNGLWPYGKPIALDNCDDSLYFSASFTNVIDADLCHRQYEITYWTIDHCGNRDSCTQILSVVDTTAPELVACSTLVVYDCQGAKSVDEARTDRPGDADFPRQLRSGSMGQCRTRHDHR